MGATVSLGAQALSALTGASVSIPRTISCEFCGESLRKRDDECRVCGAVTRYGNQKSADKVFFGMMFLIPLTFIVCLLAVIQWAP